MVLEIYICMNNFAKLYAKSIENIKKTKYSIYDKKANKIINYLFSSTTSLMLNFNLVKNKIIKKKTKNKKINKLIQQLPNKLTNLKLNITDRKFLKNIYFKKIPYNLTQLEINVNCDRMSCDTKFNSIPKKIIVEYGKAYKCLMNNSI